jgi:LysM domain
MLKRLLAVCAGLALTLSVFAATVELRDDAPGTYTVKKGDTLWDISAHFLRQPWLWPEVWQNNQQIANPHLIYPGDIINLSYFDGKPRLSLNGRGGGLGPHARATSLDEAIQPMPLSLIKPFLKRPRMVTTEAEFKGLPYVVAIEEDQVRGANGQFVYVRQLNAQPGDRFAVVRPTNVFREVVDNDDGGDAARKVSSEPLDSEDGVTWIRQWNKWQNSHWGHGAVIGYEMLEIGEGRVTKVGDPSSLLIDTADMEIRPGDRILPVDTHPYDSEFVPHPPRQLPQNMRVLAFTDALDVVGRLQVIALSRGTHDGVENGQVYSVFAPGDQVRDRIKYSENDFRTTFSSRKAMVQLPEEYIGHVMIFRVFDKVSYALVMDGIRPIHLYDRLYEPDHR